MSKIKYTEEIKISVVKEVIEKNKSKKQVSRETGIEETSIRKWVRVYEENGIEGLKVRQNAHKKYDGNFKLNVVKYKQENNLSAKETAAYFNIATGVSVNQWEKKYREGGAQALFEETRGCKAKMPRKKRIPKKDKL